MSFSKIQLVYAQVKNKNLDKLYERNFANCFTYKLTVTYRKTHFCFLFSFLKMFAQTYPI